MKMTREQIEAGLVARRVAAEPLIRQGLADREIARRVGVSAMSVGKWRKQLGQPRVPAGRPKADLGVPAEAIAAAEAAVQALSSAPPPEPEELGSTLDEVRGLLRELKMVRKALAKSENLTARVRVLSTCVQALNNAARLEKALAEDHRAVTVTPEALDTARDLFRERVDAILARPMLCDTCNRALSIQWGTGTTTEPEPERGAS